MNGVSAGDERPGPGLAGDIPGGLPSPIRKSESQPPVTPQGEHVGGVGAWALRYAEAGWKVLPIFGLREDGFCACGDTNCDKIAKHPVTSLVPHAVKDASCDATKVRGWWSVGDWNIGVACGESSGLVTDVDGAEGRATLDDLEPLGETLVCETGGGGLHLWWRPVLGLKNARVLPGIDIKTDGGYVVVPPSVHRSGVVYSWVGDWEVGKIAELPLNVLSRLRTGSSGRTTGPAVDVTRGAREGYDKGERDVGIFYSSLSLLHRYDDDEAWRRVQEIAAKCRPPFSESETAKCFASARGYVQEALARRTGKGGYAQSDAGLVEEFTDVYGDLVRWDASRARWFRWEERIWRDVGSAGDPGPVIWLVRDLAAGRLERAMLDGVRTDQTWALRCQNIGKLEAAVRLARAHPGLRVTAEVWDADMGVLNTPGGLVHLRTGEVRAAVPDDYVTRGTTVSPGGEWRGSEWERFLLRVQPEADARRFLKHMAGMLLGGVAERQGMFFFVGSGANGKSVYLDAVTEIMGSYAGVAPKKLVANRNEDDHPEVVARQAGRRVVRISEELAARDRLNSSLMKSLTSGGRQNARFMGRDSFEFAWVGKILFESNEHPRLDDVGYGIRRRMFVVPWPVEIPDDEQVPLPELVGRLVANGDAWLSWALEGRRELMAVGWDLERTADMELELEVMIDDADEVKRFFDECRVTGTGEDGEDGAFISHADLYGAYQVWRAGAHLDPRFKAGPVQFTQAAVRLGLGRARDPNGGGRGFRGSIGVRPWAP